MPDSSMKSFMRFVRKPPTPTRIQRRLRPARFAVRSGVGTKTNNFQVRFSLRNFRIEEAL
jgi:hypothetical protein